MERDNFIFRSPLLPLNSLFELLNKKKNFIFYLKHAYKDQKIRDALYISSPILYDELLKSDQNENKWESSQFISSLLKYYIRASTRCTPFGLFASVNIGNFSDDKSEIIILENKIHSKVAIDFEVLNSIYNNIKNEPEFLDAAFFTVNSSLYKFGKQYRYIEHSIINGHKTYILNGISCEKNLNRILKKARNNITLSELTSYIHSMGFSLNQAHDYILELIKSQILVDDMISNLCGQEYHERLINRMCEIDKYKPLGSAVLEILKNENYSFPQKGIEITNLLKNTNNVQFKTKSILKVESSKMVLKSHLSNEIKNRIIEATLILAKLQEPRPNTNLIKFKRLFSERYENAEIDLLESLDSDIGIGYASDIGDSTQESILNQNSWSKQLQFKFELIKNCHRERQIIVNINESHIDSLLIKSNPLPDSVAFFGSILRNNDQDTILFHSLIGPSAINLIGRFGHLSEDIKSLCKSLAKEEENKNPDKIYASLSHVPQDRVGNVLAREQYRDYEIPYLTHSNFPNKQKIFPSDLTVSLRNNKLILKSKSLKKEIVPRNDNAHNYGNNTLPVYHFLSDLQGQNLNTMITWDWGIFNSEKFLPRVVYKDIILSLATWKIDSIEFKYIFNLSSEDKLKAFLKLQQSHNLPNYVQLVEGDNLLLLNLNSPHCIDIVLNKSKQNKIITLVEFLFTIENSNLVKNSSGEFYTNEIIVPIIKSALNEQVQNKIQIPQKKPVIKNIRTFAPLGEWLYIKLYCSFSSADSIIKNTIYPIVSALKRKKLISKWFFIRYNDPHSHIRLRIQIAQDQDHGEIYKKIHKNLDSLLKSGQVWNVNIDTYKREIERYGDETIELSETLFTVNSDTVCRILKTINSQKANTKIIIGLLGVHYLFNAFELNTNQRIHFINQICNLNNNIQTKSQRTQFKNTYRIYQNLIKKIISNLECADDFNFEFDKIHKIFKSQNTSIKNYIHSDANHDALKESVLNNLGSYIHMFINRLFDTNQNYYENHIYQFLKKSYSSEIARQALNHY